MYWIEINFFYIFDLHVYMKKSLLCINLIASKCSLWMLQKFYYAFLKNNLFHPYNTISIPSNQLKFLQLTDVYQFTCVNLNCCSTSGMTVLQSRHMKVPNTSSGWTGWVRTTWPEILSSVPILAVVISRTLQMHKSQHDYKFFKTLYSNRYLRVHIRSLT